MAALAPLSYPPLPSWRRYRKLFRNSENMSLLRQLQYEALSQVQYGRTILDFGGGANAHYREELKHWSNNADYHSVNIAKNMAPTFLVSVGEKLPIDEAQYDTVISFNTLEHVYDPKAVLNILFTLLKPGGNLILVVPFMHKYHPSPEDFMRMTPIWYSRTLDDIGFADARITPQYWGPFTAGAAASGLPGPFKKWRFRLALWADIAYARTRAKPGAVSYDDSVCRTWTDHALGYLVEARRPLDKPG